MNKRILYIITGIVLILLGILCAFDKNLAAILCGIGLIIYGIGKIPHWRERRKAGAASIWTLAGILAAVLSGLVILIGRSPGIFVSRFLLVILSVWLLAEGVLEILGAVMYQKAMTSTDLGVQAPGSLTAMFLGIVMIIVGILGLVFQLFAAYAFWAWSVAGLIVLGTRIISLARSAGVL